MFFDEFELLDLRMSIMDPYVDYFVLVESSYSHTGNRKPLYFNERLKEFNCKKIRHIIVDEKPMDVAWDNENFQRNNITRGLFDADPDDIIVVSDVDEIPNPIAIINNLNLLKKRKIFSLKQKMFYFYINFMLKERWRGPAVCKKKNMKSPQWMRKKRFGFSVNNGGWHYGYLGGENKVRQKIDRVCHTDINIDIAKDIEHIKKCMKTGCDLFERRKKLKIVDLDGNSPNCIKKYMKKYPEVIREKIS